MQAKRTNVGIALITSPRGRARQGCKTQAKESVELLVPQPAGSLHACAQSLTRLSPLLGRLSRLWQPLEKLFICDAHLLGALQIIRNGMPDDGCQPTPCTIDTKSANCQLLSRNIKRHGERARVSTLTV